MADKFAITAELNVRLAAGVTTQIKALQKKLDKVELDVTFNKDSFDKDTKYIYASFRELSKTIKKNPFEARFNVDKLDKDTKYIYASYKQIKKTLDKSTLNVRLNKDYVDSDIKYLIASYRTTKNTIDSKKLNFRINRQGIDSDIKYIMASMRSLLGTLANKTSNIKIDAVVDPAFQRLQQTVGAFSGKTIRVNIAARDKSLAKFKVLTDNLNTLNAAVKSFDLGKLATISGQLGNMSGSLKSLSLLSRKNFAFNFSFKNMRMFDLLTAKLTNATNAFHKATFAGISLIQVLNQIASTVQSIGSVKVNVGGSGRNNSGSTNNNAASGQKSLNNSIQATTDSVEELGRQTGITFRRFGAYTLATAGFFQLTFALKAAIKEFINYESELTKVRQVTGQSLKTTELLSKKVGELATSYGVSSSKILDTSLVLAQAGYTAKEVSQALETLAKTELAATFENLPRTVEGAIAAMAQFKYETKDLGSVLSSVNSVSAKFAVESDDIITAIQKAGGAFAAAGGNLNELQALFTAVRATTRESADSIATGFRTIFTRLQRVRTQEFLRGFGIDLNYTTEEAKKFGKTAGEFVGPYEAIRRLHTALKEISTTDPRYAQITEELGGFRQISKVIPLLQQFPKAIDVLNVAQKSNNSLTEDAIIAQESFANKLTKVREEFLLVIREFGSDKEIKSLINGFISLADSLVNVLRYTKELVPAFVTLGTVASIPVGAKFLKGASSIIRRASGGYIPGSGTKDDVPALLMKGEYVLNKRAVRKIGKDNLDKINFQRFATGGSVGGSGSKLNVAGNVGLATAIVAIPLAEEYFGKLNDTTKDLIAGFTAAAVGIKALNFAVDASRSSINKYTGVNDKIRANVKERRAARSEYQTATQDYTNKEQLYKKVLAPGRRDNLVNYISSKQQQEAYNKSEFEKTIVKLNSSRFTARMNPNQITNLKRRAISYKQQYNDAKNNRQKAQNSLFEYDTAQQDLNDSGARVKSANDRVAKSRLASRVIKLKGQAVNFAAKGGGALAIGGAIGGQLLQASAERKLDRIRENGGVGDIATARNFSAAGGALQGAGTGAAAGLLAGSAFGPLGSAIGGAAGLIIGGAQGFLDASKEFDKAIKSLEIGKITDALDKTLKNFSQGKTTASIASSSVIGGISTLQKNLQNESDPEVRKDILANLDSNSVNINEFVNELAKSSDSVQNFNQRINETTRRFIASIIGIPFEELSRQVEQQIDDQKKAKQNAKNQAVARNDFESQIRALIALRQAFVFAESKINSFADTLQNFVSESSGATRVKTSFRGVSGLDTIPNINEFSNEITTFSASFGSAGKTIGSFVSEAGKAVNLLPDIFLNLKSQGSFANESDLSNSLSDKLDAAGISGAIKNTILAKLPEVLGQDFKDSEFFRKVDEDLPGVVKTFTEGFEKSFELIKDSAQTSADQLQNFADRLGALRSANLKGIIDTASLQDFNSRLIESKDTFTGKRPSFDRLLGVQNVKENIITGGQSAAQLQAANQKARANVFGLENKLDNTTDVSVRKDIISAIDAEKLQIDKTTQALKYLADNTSKLTILQQKLNQAQSDRLKHKDFAVDSVFGDTQTKVRQRMVLNSAQLAASSGNANVIPDSMKQEVLSLFRGFGDTKLPGLNISGSDAIDKILKNSGVSKDIINPGKEEQSIQAQIEKQISIAAESQKSLNDILANDRTAFSAAIHKEWTDFVSNLDQSLKQSLVSETNNKLSSAQSSLAKKQSDLSFIKSVGLPALNNVDDIKNTEKRLKEIGTNPETLSDNLKSIDSLRSAAIKDSTLTRDSMGRGIRRISFDKASDIFDKATAGVSDDVRNRIISKVQSSDIGADYSNKTVELNKVTDAIKLELEKEKNTTGSERSTLRARREELINNVGGYRQYAKIMDNADNIQKESSKLESKDTASLTAEIARLNATIKDLNIQKQTLGFSSGGIVPGSGNFDSVPARLTPGEGVINKQAMAKYGPGIVKSINSGKFPKNFATGGVVGDTGITIDTDSLSKFNLAVQNLSTQIDRLQAAFSSIPTEISMNGTHTVELIINGAQVLTQLQPEIVKMIESGAKDAINKMLKNKFPQVGSYNG